MFILAAFATSALGCQRDNIQRYKASQPEFGEHGRYRILVAIFALPEQTWFFKMMGQVEWIYEHKDEFKSFIESVRFARNGEPRWTLPDGWREEKGKKQGRFKTLVMGHKDKTVELTITALAPLGKGENTILGNVNRWRGQLGLKNIAEKELSRYCREVKAGDQTAIVVELTGPGARPAPLIDFKLPVGWEQIPKVEFSLFAFEVKEKGKKALITISLVKGELVENINRWRTQVDLQPITKEQMVKEKKTIKIVGEDAWYFDLVGKETKPGRGDRIVGAMQEKGGQTLFIKMMGPADLVGAQKAAFEAFVASIRFNVPGGEK